MHARLLFGKTSRSAIAVASESSLVCPLHRDLEETYSSAAANRRHAGMPAALISSVVASDSRFWEDVAQGTFRVLNYTR